MSKANHTLVNEHSQSSKNTQAQIAVEHFLRSKISHDYGINSHEVLILTFIASYIGNKNSYNASREMLRRDTRLSLTTVKRTLKSLEAKQLISIEYIPGDRSRYSIITENLLSTLPHMKTDPVDNNLDPVPIEPGVGPDRAGGGLWESRESALGEPTYNKEKQIENKDNTARARESQVFDNFWLAYPKKVERSEAIVEFEKINPDDCLIKKIINDIKKMKESSDWTKEKGKYIPRPAKYLREKAWETRYEAANTNPRVEYWTSDKEVPAQPRTLNYGELLIQKRMKEIQAKIIHTNCG